MPDSRPGIRFVNGVCLACIHEKDKDKTNWDARFNELLALANRHRREDGGYDCLIAASGGKDSFYQTYVFKELLRMNPLLVSVEDAFSKTAAGEANIRNLSEHFGVHYITLKPSLNIQKKLAKYMFVKYGKPTWYIDRLIYTYPLFMAKNLGIPLLVYGENIAYEYGGLDGDLETFSAKNQLANGVASDVSDEELLSIGLSKNDIFMLHPPSLEGLEPIYLSYFMRWNSHKNYLFSKKRGFKDLGGEWQRTQTIENYDQIDSIGYLLHCWLKYPKFAHAQATDYASKYIRYGMMDKEEAKVLVKKHDHALDPRVKADFCDFISMSEDEFLSVIDGFYNEDYFSKIGGKWVLKKELGT